MRNISYRMIKIGRCHACACASVQGVASKGAGHSLCLYPALSPTHGEPSVHFYFNILSISQISSAICSIIRVSLNALLQFKLVCVFSLSFIFLFLMNLMDFHLVPVPVSPAPQCTLMCSFTSSPSPRAITTLTTNRTDEFHCFCTLSRWKHTSCAFYSMLIEIRLYSCV